MDFNDFVLKVKEEICDCLINYDIENIIVKEVEKNNEVTYTGIIISSKDKKAAPTIYLDYYYEQYKNGVSFKEIIEMICESYKQSIINAGKVEKECNTLDNYNERLFIRVVNYEKNKNILNDCPFIPFFDLAVTFRYLVHKDNMGISSALVKNNLVKDWGLNIKKLYDIAKKNTKKMFPPTIMKLTEMLKDYVPKEELDCYENNMYVLTNNCRVNGATYIIEKDILKDFSDKIRKDFYIIPSSIHEIILVPIEEQFDVEGLKMLVEDVNNLIVSDVDFLSNNIYLFKKEEGLIAI